MDSKAQFYGDHNYNTEEDAKSSLIHICLFVIYLTLITIVSMDFTTHTHYYFIKGVRDIMESGPYTSRNQSVTFQNVISIEDFWNYMEYVVIPQLYGTSPRLKKKPNAVGRLFLNESLLLGPPRLRQVRVKEQTCERHPALQKYFDKCFGPYKAANEFTESTYKGTKFYTMQELDTNAIKGLVTSFPTGGYVKRLSYNNETNLELIQQLRKDKWLDRASRMVLLEFNMLNLNLDLLLATKLSFEIMPNGLVYPMYISQAFYAHPPGHTLYSANALSWILLSLLFIYYTYVEIKVILRNGLIRYFQRFSTALYLSSIVSMKVGKTIRNDDYNFISLDLLSSMHFSLRVSMALLVLIAWILSLSFMNFNPVFRTLTTALKLASTDLTAFFIMFTISFVAYGNLGMILFGNENIHFRDLGTSLMTMVRFLVRDFNYFELDQESAIAPLYFLTGVLFINFILINMFLAVLILSYKTAKLKMAYTPSFLLYYTRKQLYRISGGVFSPPRHPDGEHPRGSHATFGEGRLNELLLIKEYSYLENDLDLLHLRLDVIENAFHGLSNNLEDLLRAPLKEYEGRNGKRRK